MIKKIESREEREKKEQRNKTILGIFIVVIMLFSTAGYAFFSMEKTGGTDSGIVKYGEYTFQLQGDSWVTEISGQLYYFYYLPNETLNININKKIGDYSGKPLYFTSEGAAEPEIVRNIGRYASRVQLACLSGENCTEDLPEKTCADNIIIVKEKDFRAISEENNCVYIFSNDTLRDADAFIYKVLGIN